MPKFKKKGNAVLLTLISFTTIAVIWLLTRENKIDRSDRNLEDFNQLEREFEARILEKNKTMEENLRLILEEEGLDYYDEIKIFGELDQSEVCNRDRTKTSRASKILCANKYNIAKQREFVFNRFLIGQTN